VRNRTGRNAGIESFIWRVLEVQRCNAGRVTQTVRNRLACGNPCAFRMFAADKSRWLLDLLLKRMSTIIQLFALALYLQMGLLGRAAVQPRQDVDSVSRLASAGSFRADFETVWQLVRDKFHDPKFNGVDWKRIGDTYRAKLAEIRSKFEFVTLINHMLSELHASHAAYVTDDDVEFYMLPAVLHQDMNGHRVEHIGIMGSRDGAEFVVAGVLEGGPADKAGIQSGDRLVLGDGLPFRSAGSFREKEGKPVTLQFKRGADSNLRSVIVVPIKQNILQGFLAATDKSAKILSVGGRRLGYVHLWTMANDAFRTALERLVERKLHDTDGLILDLRDGYGGSPWNYADVFFRPDVAWEQQSRGYGAVTRYSGYGKPMVVLVNQGTRSAKEFLSYEFKTTRRAKLVGSRTAGAFLGAGGFDVGTSGLLELPILGLKIDGKPLEDNGVTPDLTIAPRFTYSERDAQLQAAQQALLDSIKDTVRAGGSVRTAF
jgi:carboxyl-terminal processing protease